MVLRTAVSWNGDLKTEKLLEKHISTVFLSRGIAETLFFASVLPTDCLLITVEKVAPKQFQLRDIAMGRFILAGRLALCFPTFSV